jgi:hypothetical protein
MFEYNIFTSTDNVQYIITTAVTHAFTLRLASPALSRKSLNNMGLNGRQITSLPEQPINVRPALKWPQAAELHTSVLASQQMDKRQILCSNNDSPFEDSNSSEFYLKFQLVPHSKLSRSGLSKPGN